MEWHVITGEYPPQPGGVSDYTRFVARGLVAAGDTVHVWCPDGEVSPIEDSGVIVHRELGSMGPRALLHAGRMLDKFNGGRVGGPAGHQANSAGSRPVGPTPESGPRRILVQWVPHAFGFHSANLPFCLWIWSRAVMHGDHVELMVHEPYLPLRQKRLKHVALAVLHRLMLTVLLNAASRVWTAIPKWEERCRPYALGRSIPFSWLPVISNIPVDTDCKRIESVKSRYAPSRECLIGHFGTCGGAIGDALQEVIPALLQRPDRAVLLIGRDSRQFRELVLKDYPGLVDRLHATGSLTSLEVSSHISACDMMIQPYPDGVSSRRGSLLAGLSHGKAVVSTSGHLSEPVWYDSGALALVPAGNYRHMIAAAETLIAHEPARARLAVAARRMYERHFGLQKLIPILRDELDLSTKEDAAAYQQSS
jgi:glycosyltransferase involved in cell wall biosynthesis